MRERKKKLGKIGHFRHHAGYLYYTHTKLNCYARPEHLERTDRLKTDRQTGRQTDRQTDDLPHHVRRQQGLMG